MPTMRETKISLIESGELLTEEKSRIVDAALALAGHSRSSWSSQSGLNYTNLRQMLKSKRVVMPKYAVAMNQLLASQTQWLRIAA